jgi:hypothetical protein
VDPALRARFNAAYTPAVVERYSADLVRRIGGPLAFRVAETPVFVPDAFRERVLRASSEIVAQLSEPARLAHMTGAVPERWSVPKRSALPTFAVLDFAAARAADGTLEPRLVEMQGFPSLLAFEVMQGDAWDAALNALAGLEGAWTGCFPQGGRDELIALARDVIVGPHDPAQVVLMDLDPWSQKTACDFYATRRLFGIDAVAPQDLVVRGGRLYRRAQVGCPETPVARIYNRTIVDEIERTNATLPFDYRDDIDVEWAPHPDWFFIWSKSSLPYLDHPAVPRTRLLSDVAVLPDDVAERYVLKPLFSFAGGGVNVHPSRADIEAVPHEQRAGWCLQEKIDYAPAIAVPDGATAKVEMRVMLLRREGDAAFTPAINLSRLTRGAMVGVDYNRDMPWTGSTIGVWRTG